MDDYARETLKNKVRDRQVNLKEPKGRWRCLYIVQIKYKIHSFSTHPRVGLIRTCRIWCFSQKSALFLLDRSEKSRPIRGDFLLLPASFCLLIGWHQPVDLFMDQHLYFLVCFHRYRCFQAANVTIVNYRRLNSNYFLLRKRNIRIIMSGICHIWDKCLSFLLEAITALFWVISRSTALCFIFPRRVSILEMEFETIKKLLFFFLSLLRLEITRL